MIENSMYMARSPLRITFVGGGTDIADFYRYHGPGICVSAAIDKYIFVLVNKKFDSQIRVSYSRTEIVDTVAEIQHPTVREALKYLGIDGGIEIVSISDIPSQGTGLGSSSTFLVSLLHALHSYIGQFASASTLAKEAVKIEREILKEPGGKQDQYIAAYGGVRSFTFQPDESVKVTPIIMKQTELKRLQSAILLLYTGKTRASTDIHRKQSQSIGLNLKSYERMVQIAEEFPRSLNRGDLEEAGRLVDENWKLKAGLAEGISSDAISALYEKGIRAGAYGGKLVGAGGGGFLLFIVDPDRRSRVKEALHDLREVEVGFDYNGSSIIYVGD
jgi:D-glycero-alpha-D-manno-heptose-7-phosphate kinase